MRFVLIALPLLFALACASDVNRLDGEGCQPACRTLDTESEAIINALCLDVDLDPETCAEAGTSTPACAEGMLSCESGTPVCVGAAAANSRPICSR